MGELSAWHWAIVILAAVLLFGSTRLPEAARSLGRSARILKAELRAGSEPTPPPAVEPVHPTAPAQSTQPAPAHEPQAAPVHEPQATPETRAPDARS